MKTHGLRGLVAPFLFGTALVLLTCGSVGAQQEAFQPASPIHEVRAAGERLEMLVNTSRILSLSPELTQANRVPQVDVGNPDILDATPLSPTQVQVFAKKPGVTAVNLWDEKGGIHAIDVVVFGDARELSLLLQSQFPNAALKVIPVSNGVLISGYVDQACDIPNIIQIAEQYYPRVLNNIRVGGVHQVLLHVKAMEVSRTKLRNLGFDWRIVTSGGLFVTGVSGLIDTATLAMNPAANLRFDILGDNTSFFGVLEALREDNLAKILAEPTLVTTSGRPAYFQVGGEVPYLVPQSLGNVTIAYKDYGTRVDFVPIVLGNGRIRLEVRPHVSDIDTGRSIMHNGQIIYAFKKHEVDTGVELQAGQTLAIAGLVQNRIESYRRGVPWLCDVPYAGALFRSVEERNNEIELLIFVTPELVDAMDAREVPPCGPGLRTTSPSDCQLGLKSHLEVPNCCPAGVPGMIHDESGQILPAEPIMAPDELTAPMPPDVSIPSPSPRDSASVGPRRQKPSNRRDNRAVTSKPDASELPGFLGPIGYELAE
jgi:pilus assembly protein CpaC